MDRLLEASEVASRIQHIRRGESLLVMLGQSHEEQVVELALTEPGRGHTFCFNLEKVSLHLPVERILTLPGVIHPQRSSISQNGSSLFFSDLSKLRHHHPVRFAEITVNEPGSTGSTVSGSGPHNHPTLQALSSGSSLGLPFDFKRPRGGGGGKVGEEFLYVDALGLAYMIIQSFLDSFHSASQPSQTGKTDVLILLANNAEGSYQAVTPEETLNMGYALTESMMACDEPSECIDVQVTSADHSQQSVRFVLGLLPPGVFKTALASVSERLKVTSLAREWAGAPATWRLMALYQMIGSPGDWVQPHFYQTPVTGSEGGGGVASGSGDSHLSSPTAPTKRSNSKSHSSDHSGGGGSGEDGFLKCQYCDMQFLFPAILKNHIKSCPNKALPLQKKPKGVASHPVESADMTGHAEASEARIQLVGPFYKLLQQAGYPLRANHWFALATAMVDAQQSEFIAHRFRQLSLQLDQAGLNEAWLHDLVTAIHDYSDLSYPQIALNLIASVMWLPDPQLSQFIKLNVVTLGNFHIHGRFGHLQPTASVHSINFHYLETALKSSVSAALRVPLISHALADTLITGLVNGLEQLDLEMATIVRLVQEITTVPGIPLNLPLALQPLQPHDQMLVLAGLATPEVATIDQAFSRQVRDLIMTQLKKELTMIRFPMERENIEARIANIHYLLFRVGTSYSSIESGETMKAEPPITKPRNPRTMQSKIEPGDTTFLSANLRYAPSKWMILGTLLTIPHPSLQLIEENHPENKNHQFMEFLELMIQQGITWRTLVETLRKNPLKLNTEARDLQKALQVHLGGGASVPLASVPGINNKPQLQEVLFLFQGLVNWQLVAIYAGLEQHMVQIIEANKRNNISDQVIAMITQIFKTKPNTTWTTLIEALDKAGEFEIKDEMIEWLKKNKKTPFV